ncbi:MAG: hypothetical protein R3A52_27785 [Polyangiales bacterium]
MTSPSNHAPYRTRRVDAGLLRYDDVPGSDGTTRRECCFDTQG